MKSHWAPHEKFNKLNLIMIFPISVHFSEVLTLLVVLLLSLKFNEFKYEDFSHKFTYS